MGGCYCCRGVLVAHGAADIVACTEESMDDVGGYEAGGAGDKDCLLGSRS